MLYRSIWKPSRIEITEKRSLFIGRALPSQSQEEAEAFVARVKEKEKTATHNCSCYRLGIGGLQQKYDDDGEPRGTAGIPMLAILKKEELTFLSVVVTRYFGGIKLGASGLVRIYGEACRQAVHAARIVEVGPFHRARAIFDYPFQGKIDYAMRAYQEVGREYGSRVQVDYLLAAEDLDKVSSSLINLTNGSLLWEVGPMEAHALDQEGRALD